MASTSVVLPWSTWATMATLRMSLRVGMAFVTPGSRGGKESGADRARPAPESTRGPDPGTSRNPPPAHAGRVRGVETAHSDLPTRKVRPWRIRKTVPDPSTGERSCNGPPLPVSRCRAWPRSWPHVGTPARAEGTPAPRRRSSWRGRQPRHPADQRRQPGDRRWTRSGVGATEDLRLQRLHLEEGPQRVRRTVRRGRGVHGVRHARRDGVEDAVQRRRLRRGRDRDAREHRQARTGQPDPAAQQDLPRHRRPTSCRRGSRTSTTWAASTRCRT